LLVQLGQTNLGVQMDLYHCQRVEGDAVAALKRYLPTGRVKHLQVAGVPERQEPQFTGPGDDASPGIGLDYARVFEQLQALGYSGDIGCEYRPKGATRDGLGWIRNTGFSGTMEAFESRA
jgi:hydroxypyruvate isomerase